VKMRRKNSLHNRSQLQVHLVVV